MRSALLALLALCLTAAGDSEATKWVRAAAHAAGPVSAQTGDADRPAPRGAVIRGRVVQGDSGLPVADAAVSLVPLGRGAMAPGMTGAVAAVHGQRSAIVDRAGRFELTGVEAGYYRLAASPGSTVAQYLTGRFPDPRSDDPPVLTIARTARDTAHGARGAARDAEPHGDGPAPVEGGQILFLAGLPFPEDTSRRTSSRGGSHARFKI